MITEQQCIKHLKTFEDTSQKKIDALNQKLNAMKTQIQQLNQYIAVPHQQRVTFECDELEKQIKSALSLERKEHIDNINNIFASISNDCVSKLKGSSNGKDNCIEVLMSLQREINEMFQEIANKAETTRIEGKHMHRNIREEIDKEFNTIYTLVRLLYLFNCFIYFWRTTIE